MRIATSRYFAKDKIRESGLVPVGTTVGAPKFSLGYEVSTVAMLAPYGVFGREGISPDEYRRLYRRRLNRFGVSRIGSVLAALANGESEGVVLLCFCDLEKDFCHRRLFAEWWFEKTGEEVPEL